MELNWFDGAELIADVLIALHMSSESFTQDFWSLLCNFNGTMVIKSKDFSPSNGFKNKKTDFNSSCKLGQSHKTFPFSPTVHPLIFNSENS